jgi:hypothetical protein
VTLFSSRIFHPETQKDHQPNISEIHFQ